jgi:hypothetical protein
MSGFDRTSWREVRAFSGRVAGQADVEQGAAVFALSDTRHPAVFEEPLPQPAIWYDEDTDKDFAVLIIQAEEHTTDDGEVLQVLGLLLPDGRTAVGFTEDVEEVDGEDPDWLDLVEADLAGQDDEP